MTHSDGEGLRGIELAQAVLAELPGGSIVSALIDEIPAVQRKQAREVLARVIEILGDPEHDLVARIRTDHALARLLWDVAHAGARAESEAKLRALARVASSAVRDEAQLDEARYILSVLAQLDVIHVRVLVAIEDADLPKEVGLDLPSALKLSTGMAEALSADLLRLALVETPGMSFRGLHSKVRLAPFGREVLRLLRD